MDKELLGRKIFEYRKIQGLSKEKFAEMIGISINFLSDIERGTKSPSLAKLSYIASVLNLPMDYFFRDDDKCFQLFTINEFTNRIKDLPHEKLNSLIDILEMFLKFAEEDK